MAIYNPAGMHEYYLLTARHWHAGSERYTGADSLLTAQQNGWRLLHIAHEKTIHFRGGRITTVYYFELVRGSERLTMPILENPFVQRMLHEHKILLRPAHKATVTLEVTQTNAPAPALVRR